ncbi:hypothetical protein [Streptomyces sp. NPDC015125]|uniref:hypothetical protein n=1 Tax=Streptomyces sp. NPDC015125 TaxID=3364938 RepID=UPI0036F7A430
MSNDPEHALGACAGFLVHDLGSQVHERDDAGAFFGAAEHLRGVDVGYDAGTIRSTLDHAAHPEAGSHTKARKSLSRPPIAAT